MVHETEWDDSFTSQSLEVQRQHARYVAILKNAARKGAMFDARVFNILKEEVANLIYWRQLDASRNSVQMLGQAWFSHKELQNKSCNQIQDLLMLQKGISWNDLPAYLKRGSCCVKEQYYPEPTNGCENCEIDLRTVRSRWIIDKNIPIFLRIRIETI